MSKKIHSMRSSSVSLIILSFLIIGIGLINSDTSSFANPCWGDCNVSYHACGFAECDEWAYGNIYYCVESKDYNQCSSSSVGDSSCFHECGEDGGCIGQDCMVSAECYVGYCYCGSPS